MKPNLSRPLISALLLTMLLSACGGAGNAGSSGNTNSSSSTSLNQEPGAPVFVNNTATDGLNWFNFRRRQAGLPSLSRNALIDIAAQNHSDYQRLNNTITHSQVSGKPGFTGVDLLARMTAANYVFTPRLAYAYGEVISSTGDSSGFYMAEELIAAIYHRFVIMEPSFKEAGSGAAVSSNGTYYFTTDFAANNGYGAGLGSGNVVTYPSAEQQRVSTVFYSDFESPDPVANKNEVGYPISVHADITANLQVKTFTVKPRGGAVLPVQLLTNATDRETPRSAAAIIPLSVLNSNTVYDVEFTGSADNVPLSRFWSFRTR